MKPSHGERKHSKYSASGAERWHNCPGSVALSEGMPDKDTPWALEGTHAHEVLESYLISEQGSFLFSGKALETADREMRMHGWASAHFILGLYRSMPHSHLQVETRISLPFIHPEMFGTFDSAVVEHFGTLHVFDYKYGVSPVSPKNNLQMIFYGLGLAAQYDWNFKSVRFWIIQPRVRGYDGPLFWELPILELKEYVSIFKKAVDRVERNPDKYVEGSWCHWCKAKPVCPLKHEAKVEKAISVFTPLPLFKGSKDHGTEVFRR